MNRRAVLVAALWMFGCVAVAAASVAGMWLDVPFVRQSKQACGDACIAMVMQYWQKKNYEPAHTTTDPAAILRELPPGRRGVSATSMAAFFEKHGYRAFAYAGDWNDIEHQVSQGRPLIVALKPQGDSELHYTVVAGVDDPEQSVFVNDPAQRKLLKVNRLRFEREWRATKNWTLLAVPDLK
ncbi:MAG: C39 family peptidase [Acidobacteriota bacterium]